MRVCSFYLQVEYDDKSYTKSSAVQNLHSMNTCNLYAYAFWDKNNDFFKILQSPVYLGLLWSKLLQTQRQKTLLNIHDNSYFILAPEGKLE